MDRRGVWDFERLEGDSRRVASNGRGDEARLALLGRGDGGWADRLAAKIGPIIACLHFVQGSHRLSCPLPPPTRPVLAIAAARGQIAISIVVYSGIPIIRREKLRECLRRRVQQDL